MNKKKKKTSLIVILVVLIVAIVGVLSYLGYRIISDYLAEKDYDNLASSVTVATIATEAPKTPKNPIDFDALKKKNKDIVGWIKIDDTKINYPILRSDTDDEYYLHHNMDKQYQFAGAIYMESCNNGDFEDRNTLVYGHNMNAGTMFANLHKFEDKKFFDKHKTFNVYKPGHILTYTVFAAYEYDNRHIMNSFDFSNNKVWTDYLKEIQNPKSSVEKTREVDLTINSKIITLSTCTNNNSNKRYLVQGVLTKDESTE